MEPFVVDVVGYVGVVGFVIALAALLVENQRQSSERAVHRALALRFGLPQFAGAFGSELEISGALNGVAVQLCKRKIGNSLAQRQYTRFSAEGLQGEIALRPRHGVWGAFLTAAGGPDLEVGDPEFDRLVVVKGDVARITALLDEETRRRILDFLTSGEGSERIEGGRVTRETSGRLTDEAVGEAGLREVAGLAAHLQRVHSEEREALLRTARHDSQPGVRCRALRGALTRAPGPDLEDTVRVALDDPSPELRFVAAVAREELRVLLGIGPDPAVEFALRTRALGCAVAAAVVLGVAAEPTLLPLLSFEAAEVRRAAAEALGAIGTVGAVLSLQAVASERLGLTAAAHAARHAIESIQARAGLAEAGQLTLAQGAGPLEGALAVSDAPAGGLALAARGLTPTPEDAAEAAHPPRPRPSHRVGG